MSQLSSVDPNSPTTGPFPDDVLTLVLKSTPFTSEELAHLSLVCKQFKEIATEFLYRSVCLRHNHFNLLNLLATLRDNQSLAIMVKHFTFDWATLSLRLDSPDEQYVYHHLMVQWHKDRISEVKHFSAREAVDVAISILCYEILTVLRNLESLEMGFVSYKFELLIWKDAGKGVILPKLRSFVRLVRYIAPKEPLHIQFDNGGPPTPVMPDERHIVANFYPVLLSPSLRKVKASHLMAWEKRDDYDTNMVGGLPLSHYFGTSNVEVIDIKMGCLPEKALTILFKLPRELKELRYEHASGAMMPMTLKSIGNAIRCRRSSLIRLSFQALWSGHEVLETSPISFKDFKMLKELAIPLHVLVKGRNASFSNSEEFTKPKTPQSPLSMPPLHTLLPRGLEKFTFLMSRNYFADVFEAIRRLIREKAAHFPKLKMIGFELLSEERAQWSFFQDLASLAYEHGVRLAMPDEEDEDPFALKPVSCDADKPGYTPVSGLHKLTLNRMLENDFKEMLK